MKLLSLTCILLLLIFPGCNPSGETDVTHMATHEQANALSDSATFAHSKYNGALLLTHIHSLEEFKQEVAIIYDGGKSNLKKSDNKEHSVCLVHRGRGVEVVSVLTAGISEGDFTKARNGSVWTKGAVAIRSPFALMHRRSLKCIESLGRRRPWEFGKGDVAFYDLAEHMVNHIVDEDRQHLTQADLSEKGYLNTFNHITAQAFMTSMFSEEIADFVADVHERYNLPELMTGTFSPDQIDDLENGPVDNYLDMINNEFGQELGKTLRDKYLISTDTYWTPTLLADYMNDVQQYHSWALQIGFTPFDPTDEVVQRFAAKINFLLGHEDLL